VACRSSAIFNRLALCRPFGVRQASIHSLRGTQRVQVQVRDNNVDQALKALKKKMQREGIFREMKLRNYFEKPSEKRVREEAEAVRRARKLARKKAQREGLIAGTPKPRLAAGAKGPGRGGPGGAAGGRGPSSGGGFGGGSSGGFGGGGGFGGDR
jgi:small subunit ribosomal protein S21